MIFTSQILAIHATTAALFAVTYLKKNKAVALLMPISNKSNEGKEDWIKNKIQTSITTSKD